jgi:hypothetical protein
MESEIRENHQVFRRVHLAVAIAKSRRFAVKTVAATLQVARSNLIERRDGSRPQRGPQNRAGDFDLVADIPAASSTSGPPMATGGSPRSSSASGDPPDASPSTPSASSA